MKKNRDLVVIGASAGGVQALSELMRALDPQFTGSILIVLHTSGVSILPQILQRASALPVQHARDGQFLEPGHVLIAPPDHHLLLQDHHILLSHGPKQNNARPAIDPLFRSAARTFASRVVGIILSGALDDGSAGLRAIKRAGGVAIVQDPATAIHGEMPRNAMHAVKVDHVLSPAKIGELLNQLTLRPTPKKSSAPPRPKDARLKAVARGESDPTVRPPGKFSTLTCPECGGTLWERREGNLLRFACHTGHAYSGETMMALQDDNVESALWVALRTLKERSILLQKLAQMAQRGRGSLSAKQYQERARQFERQAELLRQVLVGPALTATPKPRGRKSRR